MKMNECPQEEAVLAGLLAGEVPEHAAGCAVCSELLLVAGLLREDAADGRGAPPPPGLIWWRAQLEARRELTERSLRPILVFQKAAAAATVLALAVWGPQWVPSLPTWALLLCIPVVIFPAAGTLYLLRKG